MKLIPCKNQWTKWTMPSKVGYISFVLAVFGIFLVLIIFAVQMKFGASKSGQEEIVSKVARLESIIERKLSEPTSGEVESEIEKQFKAEFIKKKKKTLELFRKGLSAYRKHNYKIAIGHLDKAIKIFTIPSFYIYRGNSFMQISRFEMAVDDYTKAIELNPNYAMAYNNRGNTWLVKGNKDKAFADYDKASQLNPNFAHLME